LSHPAAVRNVDEHMNLVVQPAMNAGDVIFFIECVQSPASVSMHPADPSVPIAAAG